jgi:uncharacterized protein YeaO (DUF488 family)
VSFRIKNAYQPADPDDDGIRVLVDRLWPRGRKKTDAALALWMKEIAPSPALRTWFDHKPERFVEFSRRYRSELADNAALGDLRRMGKGKKVTLVYAAHDPKINHAVVLLSVLRRKRRARSRTPARARRAGA